ncbi:DUF6252 family protein [Flavobacterium amniphilum]|uniref:DUF6252 family protein n=1 Tax=Flavobacterium amniphilum TaxID=1834035 RepID=UPI002029D4D6|nr:DUF6252 family protein [Flavobacterium amniphilum]MCL9807602.1 DUF6252 family protein [Flavobacterium amniphilum]
MKKIILMLSFATALISCQSEVEFNDPAFQGRVNNEIWKANIKSAKIEGGQLVLEGTSTQYNMILRTASANVGTYYLGTTDQSSKATFDPISNTDSRLYTTGINTAAAYEAILINGGSGYVTSGIVSVSGGTGSGLKLNIEANASGLVTKATINTPGSDYKPGDVVTINGGNNNAKVFIKTVANSNGQIMITKNADGLVSGKFKFTAYDAATREVVSCKDGVFYNLPIQ